MIIALSGASGFIGRKLTASLEAKNYRVQFIPRISAVTAATEVLGFIAGADVIINLAGAPIFGRWNEAYKKSLFDSRIITTRKLVEAIQLADHKPKLLISASAIGIYSLEGMHTEANFHLADDFLGQICSSWELEAKKADSYLRVAIIRLGIVLGKSGGVLHRMLPLFRLGLGGRIASGKQGFSWIHITDLVNAVQFIIEDEKLSGEFNFTAPEVVDNLTFTKVLARVLHRPAFISIPSMALKMMLGEGSVAVTGGQSALPKHLLDKGFRFSFPDLEGALVDIVNSD